MGIGGTSNTIHEVYNKEMMIEDQEDDLMGEDVMEMEVEGSKNVGVHNQMADKAIQKSKASSSHKSGGKSRIPVGKLSKKAGFLRRGSPKLHRSSSREKNLSGRHHTGAAKNLRSGTRRSNGLEGSKNTSGRYP